MRFPAGWYQIEQTLAVRLPGLRIAQTRGLATWLYGTLSGGSACQSAVMLEWQAAGYGEAAVRQRLREFLWDGAAKAAPCTTQVEVAACFAPLLTWVLDWWTEARQLPLAVDATNLRAEVAMLVVSVLYRGSAIPVAWQGCATTPKAPDQAHDSWTDAILTLLACLRPAIPRPMQVLVLLDQGLRSPRLRQAIRAYGWHPLMRLPRDTWVRPAGEPAFVPAHTLVPQVGGGWVGRATVYKQRRTQVAATLVVVWDVGQQDCWVLLTDLPPHKLGAVWYALRMWIELGFRALQGLGWQWQRTRRTDPTRVARHWLVLAVAMLWTLAVGTRAEDAAALGRPPATLHRPPRSPTGADGRPRRFSVFSRGRAVLHRAVLRGRLWTRLWLAPTPWPDPRPTLAIVYHEDTTPAQPP
jgi:hypothetical protein